MVIGPLTPPTEIYPRPDWRIKRPEDPSFMKVLASSFRQYNPVFSLNTTLRNFSNIYAGLTYGPPPEDYDPMKDVPDDLIEFADSFLWDRNPQDVANTTAALRQSLEDFEIMNKSGWTGTGTAIAASIADPIQFMIPSSFFFKAIKGGTILARLGKGAAFGVGATLASEPFLQMGVPSRTAAQTGQELLSAGILTGMLGAAFGRNLSSPPKLTPEAIKEIAASSVQARRALQDIFFTASLDSSMHQRPYFQSPTFPVDIRGFQSIFAEIVPSRSQTFRSLSRDELIKMQTGGVGKPKPAPFIEPKEFQNIPETMKVQLDKFDEINQKIQKVYQETQGNPVGEDITKINELQEKRDFLLDMRRTFLSDERVFTENVKGAIKKTMRELKALNKKRADLVTRGAPLSEIQEVGRTITESSNDLRYLQKTIYPGEIPAELAKFNPEPMITINRHGYEYDIPGWIFEEGNYIYNSEGEWLSKTVDELRIAEKTAEIDSILDSIGETMRFEPSKYSDELGETIWDLYQKELQIQKLYPERLNKPKINFKQTARVKAITPQPVPESKLIVKKQRIPIITKLEPAPEGSLKVEGKIPKPKKPRKKKT